LGIDRAVVYVTSKLNNALHKLDDVRRAFDQTLSRRAGRRRASSTAVDDRGAKCSLAASPKRAMVSCR
jgi:hypothetical protein